MVLVFGNIWFILQVMHLSLFACLHVHACLLHCAHYLLLEVPRFCIQIITIGPVVVEMVTDTAIDGRDSPHVATTPVPTKISSLHL